MGVGEPKSFLISNDNPPNPSLIKGSMKKLGLSGRAGISSCLPAGRQSFTNAVVLKAKVTKLCKSNGLLKFFIVGGEHRKVSL
jgi:hypothetical protein